MKMQVVLLAAMMLPAQIIFSQRTDTVKRVTPIDQKLATKPKTISAPRATLIRKDLVSLKLQLLRMNDSLTVTKKEIDGLVDQMKNDLDSMSEMGEMESLRLQMAMDRMSKMMSTLSNLLKKISDTSSQIVQNLK